MLPLWVVTFYQGGAHTFSPFSRRPKFAPFIFWRFFPPQPSLCFHVNSPPGKFSYFVWPALTDPPPTFFFMFDLPPPPPRQSFGRPFDRGRDMFFFLKRAVLHQGLGFGQVPSFPLPAVTGFFLKTFFFFCSEFLPPFAFFFSCLVCIFHGLFQNMFSFRDGFLLFFFRAWTAHFPSFCFLFFPDGPMSLVFRHVLRNSLVLFLLFFFFVYYFEVSPFLSKGLTLLAISFCVTLFPSWFDTPSPPGCLLFLEYICPHSHLFLPVFPGRSGTPRAFSKSLPLISPLLTSGATLAAGYFLYAYGPSASRGPGPVPFPCADHL